MADNLFHRAHYNAIAKDIRELYADTVNSPEQDSVTFVARRTLEVVAVKLATRFKADNPQFHAIEFLDQCSPNSILYPLGELWI